MTITLIRQIILLTLTTRLGNHQIADRLQVSHNTVRRYRLCATRDGLSLERLKDLTDDDLWRRYNKKGRRNSSKRIPDWSYVHAELQRPGVTRALLHMEYVEQDPKTALGLSQFKLLFANYCRSLPRSMRIPRKPGQDTFVDFAGKAPKVLFVTDPKTGQKQPADLFVSATGVSNRPFAYATPNQRLPSWIESHNEMNAYYKRVTPRICCDNLKSAVLQAMRGDDGGRINPTYLHWAEHGGTCILPARPRRPKDKAPAEQAVLQVTRWIIARLRNRVFYSFAELNAAIRELLVWLDERKCRHRKKSTKELFYELDWPHMLELPSQPFEYAEWGALLKVDTTYHVRVEGHLYSVPYYLVGELVQPRVTNSSVELLYKGKRVALHPRSFSNGGCTTSEAHMPEEHRALAQYTPERVQRWADSIGPCTVAVVERLYHPRDSIVTIARRVSKLRRFARDYGTERLEAACERAIRNQTPTVTSIQSILRLKLDETARNAIPHQVPLPLHENVRGPEYYRQQGA